MTLPILLTVLAFALAMMELAFPSFGLLSLAAATAYTFALITGFEYGNAAGWTLVGAGILLLPLAIFFGLKILPNTPFGRRLFLKGPEGDEIQHGTRDPSVRELIGHEGVATTDLRPSGQADVEGRRLDVVGEGAFVPRGARVRVTSVTGHRVTVQAVSEESKGNTQ